MPVCAARCQSILFLFLCNGLKRSSTQYSPKAHDPRVQNTIPFKDFETVQPIYQFIKALLKSQPDIAVDSTHMMVISPDEGGMKRAVHFSNMLGLDMGMFYTRRDYSIFVEGVNPVIDIEFLGSCVEGKNILQLALGKLPLRFF